jgi:hypothetical protein
MRFKLSEIFDYFRTKNAPEVPVRTVADVPAPIKPRGRRPKPPKGHDGYACGLRRAPHTSNPYSARKGGIFEAREYWRWMREWQRGRRDRIDAARVAR